MPTLNSTIKPAHHPLSDIVRSFKGESYVVDDRFQRRLVWTPKQKVRLIETILMGYPMPDVYLHQLEAEADGNQVFSIVDGQQRITTIVQFASDEWRIEKQYLDKDNRDSPYAGLRWGDLPDPIKKEFWAYTVNSRIIPPGVTDDEIKRIFRRLTAACEITRPAATSASARASAAASAAGSCVSNRDFSRVMVRRYSGSRHRSSGSRIGRKASICYRWR